MKTAKIPTLPDLKCRNLPIGQLKPAPYNPRKILKPTDKAYQRLEASLREFGLVEPLIWNERTGHIVGGHARLMILREMGIRQVPVSVVNLSAVREKALNVVLNNQEAQSRFDPRRLGELLTELEGLEELPVTGFNAKILPILRMEPRPPEPLSKTSRVTITLEMTETVYGRAIEKITALAAELDAVSHISKW